MKNLAIKRALLALAISLIAAACGKVAETNGGDTHWLGDCDTDSDCQSGECLCGICTNTCTRDKSCLAPGKAAACFDIDSPGVKARCAGHPPSGATGICLARCDATQPCGSGTSCLQGACVRPSATADGGGSAGGASAAAGKTGSGGAGGSKATAVPDASTGGSTGTGTGGKMGALSGVPDGGWSCYVPTDALPMGTAAEKQNAQLIHDFCVNLQKSGCLPLSASLSYISSGLGPECGSDALVHACEWDVANEKARFKAGCDAEWQKVMTCAAAASYTVEQCAAADIATGSAAPVPCPSERLAWANCATKGIVSAATGSRTTCTYGAGTVTPCSVNCTSQTPVFQLECGGPAGVPLRCECSVNGHLVGDFQFDDRVTVKPIYANDCADAAQLAANGGACTNSLDCCVKYADADSGGDACICGSDPSLLGSASCADLARSMNGQVVALCPQYESTNQ